MAAVVYGNTSGAVSIVTTVVYRTSDNRPRIVALIHPLKHTYYNLHAIMT